VPSLNRARFWAITAAAVLGMAATLALGGWQWGRAQQKLALAATIEARQALPPLEQSVLATAAPSPDLLYRPVQLRGRWEPRHTLYLDNRQMHGRPGFYVVTPLRLAGSEAVVLVQRGWGPRNFVDRTQLPPVQTPEGEVTLIGRIAPAPAKLLELGSAGTGPIRQNLDLAAFRAETGLPLLEGSVVETGEPSEGLLRDWPVPATGADKNYGYAFQWWALSGVIFILYVSFQIIALRRRQAPHA
jgi:surfeit locus 1 family protein